MNTTIFCVELKKDFQKKKANERETQKYKNIKKQQKICTLSGKEAKKKGKYKFLWKLTNNIHWQGKKIKRTSAEYKKLIQNAYEALSQNQEF